MGRVSIRVRVRVSVRLKVSITWQNTIIMVAFYIMLARPASRFFTVLRMNFPVMLIAEDIYGLRLGLCRYADIGIGLAPLFARFCSTWAIDTARRTRRTSGRIFSPCATNTGRRIVSTSTPIRSHYPRIRLQIRVGIPQDLRWQTEVLTIRADKSLNK